MNAINHRRMSGSRLAEPYPIAPEAERRAAPRRRVFKRAKAVINGFRSVVDCTVRDLSPGGARIACGHCLALPERFHLVMLAEREMREVRVAWRRHDEAGLQFLSAPLRAVHLQL